MKKKEIGQSVVDDRWRVWREGDVSGKLYFRRAVGDLPEMESAKSTANVIRRLIAPHDRVLDVGCGVGHYLRSLKRVIEIPFSYTGIDITPDYITLAREAWQGHEGVEFRTGDVFSLPAESGAYDIVMSCNLFLHLPSIERPFRELIRVTRKHVLVRTLIGDRSFRIQEVHSRVTHPDSFNGSPDELEFDERGEPKSFHFHSIYARSYVERLLATVPGVRRFRIFADDEFSPERILASAQESSTPNATTVINGWQVNGYILQPWQFVHVENV